MDFRFKKEDVDKSDMQSRQRLLDRSCNVSNVSEIEHRVQNPNSSETKRKRFEVIKVGESSNLDDLTKDKAKNTSTKNNSNWNLSLGSTISRRNSEEDDVFNVDAPFKDFSADLLSQNYRDTEGQDTITSLTNNIYRKQLEKIKRKSSALKNQQLQNHLHIETPPSPSLKSNSSEQFNALKNLLGSQDSVLSKKTLSLLNMGAPITSRHSSSLDEGKTNKYKAMANSNKSINKLGRSKDDAHVVKHKHVDVEVDEAFLKNIMDSFKMQRLKLQKKRDNAKKMCLVAEILVFIGMLILTIIFVKTVLKIIQTIPKTPPSNAIQMQSDILNDSTSSSINF